MYTTLLSGQNWNINCSLCSQINLAIMMHDYIFHANTGKRDIYFNGRATCVFFQGGDIAYKQNAQHK